MIEIADNYCQVLHTTNQYAWATQLVKDIAQFKIERDVAPVFKRTHIVGFAKQAAMN